VAITVTAAESGSTFTGVLCRVKVLTGVAAPAIGATATFAGTGAQEASITTTVTGSLVYGALKTSSSTTLTAAGTTTLFDNIVDSPNGEILGACRATAVTGTPGATTIGASAPSIGGQTALLEILPLGTITEDASSPASASDLTHTTVTTAAFTPPPGSLLVAIVSADANGSTVVTVSGGGLAWTERVHSLAGGGASGYAGVWTATVPPNAFTAPVYAPAWSPGLPGAPGAVPFTPWPPWDTPPGIPPLPDLYPGTYTSLYGGAEAPAFPGATALGPPGWAPGLPGFPGGEPFVPWPQYVPGTAGAQDVLAAAAAVTATITATLTSAPSGQQVAPQYPPAWFPSAPSAPGGEPFTPWPLGQTGVNSAALNAALTVTATGAAALTEAKPLNAATTVTATAAAAETTAKPLNAAQTVTASAAAALTLIKAGQEPVPAYPPAWFPAAPGAPSGQPFTAWPVWEGTSGGVSTPVDLLTAALTITATGAAALTEAKPVNAARTVTATIAASLTTAKPLNAATTVTASRAAAETTAKPVTAAMTVTAAGVAVLADVPGAPVLFAAAVPLYVPGWFPGAPGVPAVEAFAPWPPWTGALVPPGPVFTVGTLTAADAAVSVLTGATASGGSGGVLTASDTRTGGPG
jgi:hypothetical protein